MLTDVAVDGPSHGSPLRRALSLRAGVVVVAALVVGSVGGWVAHSLASGPQELVGTAHFAQNAISIQTDDWTYSVPLDVGWTDSQGQWHDGGRPACLPPSDGASPGIRFTAVDVESGGAEYKRVVAVHCD